jgi:hypothetical protein
MCGLPDKRPISRLLAEALRVFTGSTFRPDIGKQCSPGGPSCSFSLSAAILSHVREAVGGNLTRTSIAALAIVILRFVTACAKDDCV